MAKLEVQFDEALNDNNYSLLDGHTYYSSTHDNVFFPLYGAGTLSIVNVGSRKLIVYSHTLLSDVFPRAFIPRIYKAISKRSNNYQSLEAAMQNSLAGTWLKFDTKEVMIANHQLFEVYVEDRPLLLITGNLSLRNSDQWTEATEMTVKCKPLITYAISHTMLLETIDRLLHEDVWGDNSFRSLSFKHKFMRELVIIVDNKIDLPEYKSLKTKMKSVYKEANTWHASVLFTDDPEMWFAKPSIISPEQTSVSEMRRTNEEFYNSLTNL